MIASVDFSRYWFPAISAIKSFLVLSYKFPTRSSLFTLKTPILSAARLLGFFVDGSHRSRRLGRAQTKGCRRAVPFIFRLNFLHPCVAPYSPNFAPAGGPVTSGGHAGASRESVTSVLSSRPFEEYRNSNSAYLRDRRVEVHLVARRTS
jgi:hypothetical protein